MQYAAGFLASIFTGSGKWKASLDARSICIKSSGNLAEIINVPYPSIRSVTVTDGLVWSTIEIESDSRKVSLKGVSNSKANTLKVSLCEQISACLHQTLKENSTGINILLNAVKALFGQPKYLAHYDISTWFNHHQSTNESVKATLSVLRHPFAPLNQLTQTMRNDLAMLSQILAGNTDLIKTRNKRFIENELIGYQYLFDSIEKSPLTREQRVASIVMEDRNLLVAAAGSGKTSTVVGKIAYVLSKKLMHPNEILVLAFNNHAAVELEERIQRCLGSTLGDDKIKVKTFHALGMEIIANTTGKKPSIANFASGGEVADGKLFTELINLLQNTDSTFVLQWLMFITLCRKPAMNPAQFNSKLDWQNYVKTTGDYHDGTIGYLTLQGEIVKSQGELAIANWLFINSVSYQYERPYQYETANKEFRQYKPDFYFPDIDCYLEHYALDSKGNPPKAFGNKYRDSKLWKQRLHETKGTDVFETTYAEFISGELFDKLKSELVRRGVKLIPIENEKISKNLNQAMLNTELSALLRTFIKHAKSNELDDKTLKFRASMSTQPFRAKLFAGIARKVMGAYQQKLENFGEVDFEDLIIDAANRVADEKYSNSYRLILVDEFQDISKSRAKLLQAFLKTSPSCKLFAVGDDWQSIYRFADADISIFTEFPKTFGYTSTNFLSETFRSNQGIADVAARFVQCNPSQMTKSIQAKDKITKDVIKVHLYTKLEEIDGLLEIALKEIADANFSRAQASVYILGRYRYQVPVQLANWQKKFASKLTIEYKTIHSSKGKQADYVFALWKECIPFGNCRRSIIANGDAESRTILSRRRASFILRCFNKSKTCGLSFWWKTYPISIFD